MYSVRITVGKLLEVRLFAPLDSTNVKAFKELVRSVVAGSPRKLVACCDFRAAAVFTQDVATGVLDQMRDDNSNVERSALLLAGSAVFTMQMERLIRGAGNARRRAFREPAECAAWLSEALDGEERRQLQRFLELQVS